MKPKTSLHCYHKILLKGTLETQHVSQYNISPKARKFSQLKLQKRGTAYIRQLVGFNKPSAALIDYTDHHSVCVHA